jgi:hypothetical protein
MSGLGDQVVIRCASCDYAITSRRYAVPRDCPICRQPLDPESAQRSKDDEEVTHETASVFASKHVAAPARTPSRPASAAPLPFTSPLFTPVQVRPIHATTPRGAFEAGVAPKVLGRYRDGYRAARTTVVLGTLIKVAGALLGLAVALGLSVLGSSSGEGSTVGLEGLGLGLFFGVSTFAVFFVLGVLVSSLGQLRKAALDAAVNSSPFLTNEERAEVMSLR